MRKLLRGVGVLLVGRYLARHAPQGWRRNLSLRALAGATLTGAANELIGKDNRKPAHAASAESL